ncbi:MAG: DegQ family serine endoprotease [Gammaproteobacteria bacterium]|nr:DegQ family serine endoprotease [Gammaproteobacteria bacterium]
MLRAYSRTALAMVLLGSLSLPARAASYPDFTGLVEQMSPSVVSIKAVQKRDEDDSRQRMPQLPPPWDQIFGMPRGGQEGYQPPPTSMGSGFIVEDEGYILTNSHVVHDAEDITITLEGGKELKAKLIGEDEESDVAVLKVDGGDLPAVKVGKTEDLKVGSWVVAVGAPFGFDHSVSAGIVSAKGRRVGAEQQYVPFIQTDVAINPGNSGGPLVNMDGEVIGINSQILSRTGGYMGISFAIPIDLAMDVAEQLKKSGKVKRGYLGVTYQDVDYDLAQSFGLKNTNGAVVTSVEKSSPAGKAGVEVGDVITAFDGKPVSRAADLPFLVGRTAPGSEVSLDLLRNGKAKSLDLKVGERPSGSLARNDDDDDDAQPSSAKLGIAVGEIPPQLKERLDTEGVFVAGLSNGPAARAGIRQGDVIVSIDQQPVSDVGGFKAVVAKLKPGRSVPILVMRGQARQFMVLQMPK